MKERKDPIFDREGPQVAGPGYGREPTLRKIIEEYYRGFWVSCPEGVTKKYIKQFNKEKRKNEKEK